MAYFTAGVNHKSTPISIREKLNLSQDSLPEALKSAASFLDTSEVAMLSTCNRTELYCINPLKTQRVLQWFQNYHNVSNTTLQKYAYIHKEQAAVRHIMRVASGLDSMILGEPQILGQLKTAYAVAHKTGTTGTLLNKLFQSSFSIAKKIRTETPIGKQPVSVAYAAVRLAQKIFSNLTENRVLLIGSGNTSELVARHFLERNVRDIIIANRSPEMAMQLAKTLNCKAIPLSELPEVMPFCDIIVSSTSSPTTIIDQNMVKNALKIRKHRPIFIIDLAVPRDVASSVSELPDIFLYNTDDLHHVITHNLKIRKQAAKQAEMVIEDASQSLMEQLHTRTTTSHILCQYREHIEKIRDGEIKKSLNYLENGGSAEQAVRMIAHTISNKIMHKTSVQLKKIPQSNDYEEQLIWASNLLGVETYTEENNTSLSEQILDSL